MWYNKGVIEDTDLSWLAGVFESRRSGIAIRRGYPTGSVTKSGMQRDNSMNIQGVVVVRFACKNSLARAIAILEAKGLESPGVANYGLLYQLSFSAVNGTRFLDIVKEWLTNPLLVAQIEWYRLLFNEESDGKRMVEDRQQLYWNWIKQNKEWTNDPNREEKATKVGA